MFRYLLFCLSFLWASVAMAQMNPIVYKALSDQERYRVTDTYLTTHWLDFYDPKQTVVAADLAMMRAEATDPKTACLLRFFQFRNQTFERTKHAQTAKAAVEAMRDVLTFAQANNLPAEEGISWLLLSLVTQEHVSSMDERTRRLRIYEGVVRGLTLLESLPPTALDEYHGGTYFLDHHLMHMGIYLFRIEEYSLALRMFSLGHRTGHPSFSPDNSHFKGYDHFEWNFLNDIGACYQRMNRLTEAAVWYRKAYEFGKYHHTPIQEVVSYGNIGVVLTKQKRPLAALPYLERAAVETRRLHDNESEFNVAVPLAETYLTLNQPEKAHLMLRRAVVLHDSLKKAQYMPPTDSTLLIPLFAGLGSVYQQRGNLSKALFYSQLSNRLSQQHAQVNDTRLYRIKQEKLEAGAYMAKLNRLESDRKTTLRWRNGVVMGLVVALLVTLMYLYRQRQRRRQAEQQLGSFTQEVREKMKPLNQLQPTTEDPRAVHDTLPQVAELIRSVILTDADWDRFRTLFDQVHPTYILRVRQLYPTLTPAEIRLICLTHLALSTKEMANMLGVSADTIVKTRYRIRKKANLPEGSNLAEAFGFI